MVYYFSKEIKSTSNKHAHALSMPRLNPRLLMYSSLGVELGLSVVVGFWLGSWLDGVFDTDPWLLFVFGLAGIVAGYRSIYRLHRRVQQDSREESGDSTSSTPNNG